MSSIITILGAGIGGLAAGAELKRNGQENFVIVEKAPNVPRNFKNGVHYIHTNEIDFPFPFYLKEVRAIEQIWNPFTGQFKDKADIDDVIQYSLKVMGIRHNSSILDPGRRQWKTFIPESNNMDDLIQAYVEYIGIEHFRFDLDAMDVLRETGSDDVIISTVPLPLLCPELKEHFVNRPIFTANYPAKDIVANFFVGLYIPDHEFPAYRITVLDKVISIEFLSSPTDYQLSTVKHFLGKHFAYDLDELTRSCFATGRIWGLEPEQRRGIVRRFEEDSVYLVGRYGRWDGKLTIETTIKQAQQAVNKILGKE